MSEVNEFSVYILLHIHLLISKVRSRQTYGIPLLVFHRYHFLLNIVRLHIPTPMDISYLPRAYLPSNRGKTGSLC